MGVCDLVVDVDFCLFVWDVVWWYVGVDVDVEVYWFVWLVVVGFGIYCLDGFVEHLHVEFEVECGDVIGLFVVE